MALVCRAFSLNSPCRAQGSYRRTGPSLSLANLPDPSDICDPGLDTGGDFPRRGPSDGVGWRRQTGNSDGGPLRGDGRVLREPGRFDGSGTDCELQEQLVLRERGELESNLSVHSVNPGEQGAG